LSEPRYTIRTMRRDDLDLALDWAAAEGWNPGLHDAECFHGADPGGFFMGFLGEEPVSAISAVKYGDTFGFIGLYLVRPDYRGRGYGLRIWKAALNYLARRDIGLDGVVAQQENYRRSGFEWAYANIRYQGTGGGPRSLTLGVLPLSTFTWDEILAYDRPYFPQDRSGFLRGWIAQPQSTAVGIRDEGRLAGYGVLRACRSGYKIGPLFADRADLAERLFDALKAVVPDDAALYLDLPAVNGKGIELAERNHMSPVFETARMYKGRTPDVPLQRVFGVTTFELG
jgi:GNAT superfamily N-acetyltransferase